jgi:DNA-binding transcriptional LysR family regulator
VTVTEKGELVVNYARRILAINDQILGLVVPRSPAPRMRIGIPADFAAWILPERLAAFQARAPHVRFQVRGDSSENLIRDLRQGHLDLAIALTTSGPALDARHYWREEFVWIRGPTTSIEASGPLPLVTLREGGLMHRAATSILNQATRDYEVVFTAFAAAALIAAVSVGLGVALLPRREISADVVICEEGSLPKPPDVFCGIYLRDGLDCEVLEELADAIANALAPFSGNGPAPKQEADSLTPMPPRAVSARG